MNKTEPVIVCVEDDKDIQTLLSLYISQAFGIVPFFLGNSSEAFDFLKVENGCSPNAADLILMDYQIPGMDGISAIRQIRKCLAYADIPVIMLTSSDDQKVLASAFEAGANDFITKPIRKTEFIARIKSQLRLKAEMDLRKEREKNLLELSAKLEEANRKLKDIAFLDGLTGIPNRRHFDAMLKSVKKQAERDRNEYSLIMIDIDHFKLYNDTYGHLQGDECLKKTAEILKNSLQRPSDFIARFGGEEFVAALPDTGKKGAEEVAKRIIESFASEKIPHSNGIGGYVTVSIGLASSTGTEDDVFLVEHADAALYTAKSSGRNTCSIWENNK